MQIFIGLLIVVGLVTTSYAQEQSYSIPQIIVTSPAPVSSEAVVVPNDYVNCFIVPAGYYNNIWASERQVCQYTFPNQSAWVSGYWRCTQYNTEGVCENWEWIAPHWAESEQIY